MMPTSTTPLARKNIDRLGLALFLALVVHGIIILTIDFANTSSKSSASTLEITLAMHASDSAAKDADYIAQSNQQGSGTLDDKAELTSHHEALYNDLLIKDSTEAKIASVASTPLTADTEVLISHGSSRFSTPQTPDNKAGEQVANAQHSESKMSHDIASLKARLDQRQQIYAKRPRIHRITSISAKSSVDALYQYQFQQKVEQLGNENYPALARDNNIEGDVQLVVVLKPDGTIANIMVKQSSGQTILDTAAIHSVRASAPFMPFPPEMRQYADLLEIIRTWQFSKNTLSSRG